MRIVLALPLALVLAGCNVSRDDANDSMTVQYDQNTAENAAADVGNFAQDVGGKIANDVEATADKVGNADVDVDVDANVQTNNQ
jgi:hypothetical protein